MLNKITSVLLRTRLLHIVERERVRERIKMSVGSEKLTIDRKTSLLLREMGPGFGYDKWLPNFVNFKKL